MSINLTGALFELQQVFNDYGHPELIVFQFSTRSQKEAFLQKLTTMGEDWEPVDEGPGVIRLVNLKIQLRERINT